jgi:uncharacterized glyoxalase superfamily protein PhnB
MTESFRAQKLSVSLSCNDLLKSLTWYRDVAGFTEGERYERDGSLRAVVLAAGDIQILIGQDDGAKGMNRAKGQGMSFQFTTDQNIDDIANRIKSNGGTLEHEPMDTPWGARTFRLADPDGFTLVISSERSR